MYLCMVIEILDCYFKWNNLIIKVIIFICKVKLGKVEYIFWLVIIFVKEIKVLMKLEIVKVI